MFKSLFVLAALGCSAVFGAPSIISPESPDPKLPTKALVIIHGANLTSANYEPLAQNLVKRSKNFGFNLHVSLVDSLIPGWPDPLSLGNTVRGAVNELKKKGGSLAEIVPEKDVFLSGHSLGGIFAKDLVKKEYAGLLLWGAFVNDGEMKDFGKPVLHLSGERDGQCRVTRIASMFKEFQELRDEKGSGWANKNIPVVVIPRMTHSQFTNIRRIENIGAQDLEPIISIEEAQDLISSTCLAFIGANSDIGPLFTLRVRFELNLRIAGTQTVLSGYLKSLFETDQSAFCAAAQRTLAGDQAKFLPDGTIQNTVYNNIIQFAQSKPQTVINGASVTVNTTSMLFNPIHFPINQGNDNQSPEIIACKSETNEAIAKARNTTTTAEAGGNCQQVLEQIISDAKKFLTNEQRSRYEQQGRLLRAGKTTDKKNTGLTWLSSGLRYTKGKDEATGREFVEVTAPELRTAVDFFTVPGKHYCKLLAPARVVEYMLIDAFYN
ncbi:hypothetical protein HK102_008084 [Quaeritorhiza haematococci]|nr:hypothetical protein HK102_008084 [Quaeritorhiza haematococci]